METTAIPGVDDDTTFAKQCAPNPRPLREGHPLMDILTPCPGTVRALETVPDPLFAGGLVGPGAAVEPYDGTQHAMAPITGQLLKVHPHAYVVINEARLAVLVHLGIDTVSRRGDGFTVLKEEGDQVEAGTPVIEWDPVAVRTAGLSAVIPVVALEKTEDTVTDVLDGEIAAGQRLFRFHR
ncbi:PTS sugar transporter subunit IIA [Nesterenkonia aerolata]|uniref:PTS glucose transporter subunit IIA n=1 Tax=Nesterenkonia aerolata TaxID=3074079 RepID=A0ABU2DU54_9MICC|nr:PTS glucose transporter subunit IIA [Nesterenkonia sp. LY-0111]MDR8019926.1 PTS glucose transporter subunit IIA [Nesterenkonia sp. LY-0111]